MYYLEHKRPCWICFLQTKEQRIQTQISQKTLGQQEHFITPGGAWKGRVAIEVFLDLSFLITKTLEGLYLLSYGTST